MILASEDARLLVMLSRFPAMWPGSPDDAQRLERLATSGYLVRDPIVAATYRLTLRGWAFVRKVAANGSVRS